MMMHFVGVESSTGSNWVDEPRADIQIGRRDGMVWPEQLELHMLKNKPFANCAINFNFQPLPLIAENWELNR